MVGVSVSVNLPLHYKVQKFSSSLLAPAHPGAPGKRAVKWLCVCVCLCVRVINSVIVPHAKLNLQDTAYVGEFHFS